MYVVVTKGFGISIEDIKWSCPNDLEPYMNAYHLEQKKRDEEMWLQAMYNLSAFETVMAHFGAGLAGKKSNAKYIEKPLMQMSEEKRKELTPEEMDIEIRKSIFNEKRWIYESQKKGLPETII